MKWRPTARYPRFQLEVAIRMGLIVLAASAVASANAQPVNTLRVMSYNILGGGDDYGPLSRTVDVITAAQADVIGIQEESLSADDIAVALGFHYHRFNLDIAIVSRYPITQVLTGGVKLQLSPGQEVYVFDAHLNAYPYQPYDIRDGLITTEAQAIAAAQSARGTLLNSYLNNFMSGALASGLPVFFVGDFNEPSHLDWTQEAAEAELNFGMKVDWPASNAVVNKGFSDAFRTLRPDEVNDRGETWTPGYPPPALTPNEVHDRIDFVYYKPANVAPVSAQTLGFDGNDGNTDIALQPYPSDHRAVVAEFELITLPGDYDRSGSVDAADYILWRDTVGAAVVPFRGADGNGNGGVDAVDFTTWAAHFGTTAGAGVGLTRAAPEPHWLGLLIMGCGIGGLRRTMGGRRRSWQNSRWSPATRPQFVAARATNRTTRTDLHNSSPLCHNT